MKNTKINSGLFLYISRLICIGMLVTCMLSLVGCSIDDINKLDSVSGDLKGITENIEEAVGELTEAAETIADGGSDENGISDLAGQIIDDNLSKIKDTDSGDKKNASIFPEGYGYAYSKLSGDEKELYDEIFDILMNMKEETPISSEDEKKLENAFKAVLADHPEIFWVDGYNYTKYTTMDKVTGISMAGQYNCSVEEKDDFNIRIDGEVASILSGIDRDASDYEKVKAVYEYIIRKCDYDLSSPYNQDIRSVFLKDRSVCQGYAKATQYLLNKLGVATTLVTGKALGEGHAWNMVMVDGEYYYLDTTWGDASYANEAGEEFDGRIPDINYEYFLVTTDDIKSTHKLGDNWDYPKCTSNISNYYIKEGLYFTSVDKTQLENVFDRAREKDQEYVSLKCANKDCFDEMVGYLIDDQKVFDYVGDVNTLSFAISEESLTIILWLK